MHGLFLHDSFAMSISCYAGRDCPMSSCARTCGRTENAHIDFPAMQVGIARFDVSARTCARLSVKSFINFDRG
jgi:hypothetical protein